MFLKSFSFVALVTFCVIAPMGSGQTLQTAKPLEVACPGGLATHVYTVNMAAGQCPNIVIDQREVDVAAQLSAPDGTLITRFDGEVRLREKEKIEFVAETAGDYRLEVKTQYKSAAGRYEILLIETREANDRNRLLFEAHVAITKARELV